MLWLIWCTVLTLLLIHLKIRCWLLNINWRKLLKIIHNRCILHVFLYKILVLLRLLIEICKVLLLLLHWNLSWATHVSQYWLISIRYKLSVLFHRNLIHLLHIKHLLVRLLLNITIRVLLSCEHWLLYALILRLELLCDLITLFSSRNTNCTTSFSPWLAQSAMRFYYRTYKAIVLFFFSCKSLFLSFFLN